MHVKCGEERWTQEMYDFAHIYRMPLQRLRISWARSGCRVSHPSTERRKPFWQFQFGFEPISSSSPFPTGVFPRMVASITHLSFVNLSIRRFVPIATHSIHRFAASVYAVRSTATYAYFTFATVDAYPWRYYDINAANKWVRRRSLRINLNQLEDNGVFSADGHRWVGRVYRRETHAIWIWCFDHVPANDYSNWLRPFGANRE